MSEAGPSRPRLRANKACENCRLRKTKCSGIIPCDPCRNTGIEAQCFVRTKARPNRPVPAIVARSLVTHPSALADSLDEPILSRRHASRSYLGRANSPASRLNPLDFLKAFVQQWGNENGLNAELLLFHDSPRLELLAATPLPPNPMRHELEDGLIDSLISTEDIQYLKCLDEPRLLEIYSEYRAQPNTLTDDHNALIYASLCLARYTQLRRGVFGDSETLALSRREDVTYYRMARQALASCIRASITSMWALFCIATYVQLHGGPGEYREVTNLWASHIKELGLHRQETAQLHPAQDLSETLLASYCYGETLRSIMTDLTPAIPLAQVDLDPDRIPNGISHSMARASNQAVKYLLDYADGQTDITCDDYIAKSEAVWSDDMEFLRAQRMTGMDRIKQGWAEMRLHWLRIILYIPRLTAISGQSGPALMSVARSMVNIINIHTEAAQAGKLDPSWPQLIRIMTCGQILILCSARGELHSLEATDMFNRLVALLDAHIDFWPAVQDAITGYRQAALRFDITISEPRRASTGSQLDLVTPFDGADWSAMFWGMDVGLLVDVEEQEQSL